MPQTAVISSLFLSLIIVVAVGCDGDVVPVTPDVVSDTPDDADTEGDVPQQTDISGPGGTPESDAGPDSDAAPHTVADVGDDVVGPIPIERSAAGEPVSAEGLAAATDLYLELLRGTRYFAATAERVHGWPASEPDGYWFGTWWSGVRVRKEGGAVTFLHSEDGADNNGMRTGPILSSACFAHTLWGDQELLVRALVRGFASWGLAMERTAGPDTGVVLARAHYPRSVETTVGGVALLIDYSLNRPGVVLDEETPPTFYVHNPDNPHWGDIWVKNKRSKDDLGHMLLALAFLPSCTGEAGPELAADIERTVALYEAVCARIEDDDWRIATIDENWALWFPSEDLAFFITAGGIECKSVLGVRLYGRGDAGPLVCGDGLTALDEVWTLKNDFHQIQRSFHAAAAALAALRGEPALAAALRRGIAWRLDAIFGERERAAAAGVLPDGPHDEDLGELVAMAANVGVPLTWREVRFLHDRIADAHAAYLADGRAPSYDLFAAATPDGDYPFDPGGRGIFWRNLGLLLGSCASPFVCSTSPPVLDCERVRAASLR